MSIILNERCYICNKVSSEVIETNPGEYTPKSFIRDSQNSNRSMCIECKEVHEDLMFSYEAKDDPYGWKTARKALNDNYEEVPEAEEIFLELFDSKVDGHYIPEAGVQDQDFIE